MGQGDPPNHTPRPAESQWGTDDVTHSPAAGGLSLRALARPALRQLSAGAGCPGPGTPAVLGEASHMTRDTQSGTGTDPTAATQHQPCFRLPLQHRATQVPPTWDRWAAPTPQKSLALATAGLCGPRASLISLWPSEPSLRVTHDVPRPYHQQGPGPKPSLGRGSRGPASAVTSVSHLGEQRSRTRAHSSAPTTLSLALLRGSA